jgi:Domain of unknown function (DUF6436)
LTTGLPQTLRTPLNRLHETNAFAWTALCVWLLGTLGAFWFFEMQDWRPFVSQGARSFALGDIAEVEAWFHAHLETDARGRAQLTVVHLFSPDCRCNPALERHLQRLVEHYRPRGVRFVAALAPRISNESVAAPVGLPIVVSTDRSLAHAGINTAPAALIFDEHGRLIYYGPYSDSAWCGSASGLVEPILDGALAGQPPTGRLPAVQGCFCVW